MAHKMSTYEAWIRDQGLPITSGYGVTDVAQIQRAQDRRTGGLTGYVKLTGMEGFTGMHVLELGPNQALQPDKHLFEKLIYVLGGSVRLELRDPQGGVTSTADLAMGSLAGVPLNAPHVLRNTSRDESALVLCFTNAPLVMDLFHSPDFVLNCEHRFTDRNSDSPDFYDVGDRYIHDPEGERIWIWDTNTVEDVPNVNVDMEEKKGKGVRLTQCELADSVLVTHIADWPVGSYQKCHYHGGGATLLIVRGQGHTLMWPKEIGLRPYEAGRGDEVVRVDWQEGSVMSPPDGWFHQHFNTSDVPARQLAFRYGSRKYGVEFHDLRKRGGVYLSTRQGGTLIEYEDEDPQIARIFAQECAAKGVPLDARVQEAIAGAAHA